jgi:hypothetical protein
VRWILAGRWQGATKEHSLHGSVTEEQRRQRPARIQPAGLPIFGAAAALLVGQRSIKDILPPRALPRRQICTNAPVPIYEMGSLSSQRTDSIISGLRLRAQDLFIFA